MREVVQINLRYEEWNLNLDSSSGWELIPDFVKKIIELNLFFQGWIFEWDLNSGYFINMQKFGSENKYEFLNGIKYFIMKDSICMLRTSQQTPFFDLLLKYYSKSSEGFITDNQKSEVFPAPIDFNDWTNIKHGEAVLVIHHDGDPVFLIK